MIMNDEQWLGIQYKDYECCTIITNAVQWFKMLYNDV